MSPYGIPQKVMILKRAGFGHTIQYHDLQTTPPYQQFQEGKTMGATPISTNTCPAACQPTGIFRQFEKPTGLIGWWIGQLMAHKNRQRSEWVIDLLQIQPGDGLQPALGDRVLEIGFGSGADIKRAATANAGFVAGIDHSAVMLQQATQRNWVAIQAGRVELQQADAAKLPYDEASFDRVFSINVVQFWPDPVAVLAEIHRVLKPGGWVAIALQPRNPNATELTVQQTGDFLVNLLKRCNFEQIRLETKPMQPVSGVCVLGCRKLM
jgi:SAM-dependent methyltransferase